MVPAPRLIDVRAPVPTPGAVIVLHGGSSRGAAAPVSPNQLSVLRMIPVARRIARAGHGQVAVLRLLNSVRGWNAERTPLADLDWALAEVGGRWGAQVPVVLVGHSLGGRAALLAAGDPRVRGVIALAPWVYADDRPRGPELTGTPILIVHGDADRVAPIERSRAVAAALAQHTEVDFESVAGAQHAMLTHRSRFDGRAAEAALAMLDR